MSIEGEDFGLFCDIAFGEGTDLCVHRGLDRQGGRAEQVAGGDGIGRLEKVGVSACERGFERCDPVENGDALVGGKRSLDAGIYHRGDFVEQRIVLCLEIALVEVIDDDVLLKGHLVEVGSDAEAVFEFYGASWRSRQRAEPIEVREQFGEGKRRNLEKEFSFAEQVAVAVLLAYNFGARPMKQAKGLHLVGGEILSKQLINIAELFIGEFVPPLRHDEIY